MTSMTFPTARYELKRKNTQDMIASLDKRCKSPGCDNHITLWKGVGDTKFCITCQLNLKEYGGLATAKKIYSQIKVDYCERCGFRPADDPDVAKYKDTDPKKYWDIIRSALSIDHKDGYHMNDSRENIWCICHNCHNMKTIEYGDNLTPKDQNSKHSDHLSKKIGKTLDNIP